MNTVKSKAAPGTPAAERGYYIAAVLTPHSQAILRQAIPPTHEVTEDTTGEGYHHVTLAYNQEAAFALLEGTIGDRFNLIVVGYVDNGANQAVIVTGVCGEKAIPHVSLSWRKGGAAYGSNAAIAEAIFNLDVRTSPVYGLVLEAIVTQVELEV